MPATQASTNWYCVQRRRVGGVRNPVKSTGPMLCMVHNREYAHSISNPQAVDGIYVLKPETQSPPQERRHRNRSPRPPLVVRGRPRISGVSALQEALLRGPLEVPETRTSINRQRHSRQIARALPLEPSGGEMWSGARGRARPRRRLLPRARGLVRSARPLPRCARAATPTNVHRRGRRARPRGRRRPRGPDVLTRRGRGNVRIRKILTRRARY